MSAPNNDQSIKLTEAVGSDFGRSWLTASAKRGVKLLIAYIDINDGNMHDAIIFSQIMYWHEPDENGEIRLRRKLDNHYWLTKNHKDWFRETRTKMITVRKCLARIASRKLIFYELHGASGSVSPWMRINWSEFERRMKLWTQNVGTDVTESDYKQAINIFRIEGYSADEKVPTPDTTYQPPLIPRISPLIPEIDSNTDSTSDSTSTDVLKDSASPKNGDALSTPKTTEKNDTLISPPAQDEPVKPKRKSPHEEHFRALAAVFHLNADNLMKNKTAASIYWKVASDLHGMGFIPRRIPELYQYIVQKAEEEEWRAFTVSALGKYALDFLRDVPTESEQSDSAVESAEMDRIEQLKIQEFRAEQARLAQQIAGVF